MLKTRQAHHINKVHNLNMERRVYVVTLTEILKISKVRKLKFKKYEHHEHVHVGGGIYRMYNDSGEIIYVGKTINIHKRMHQHLGKDTNTAYFIDEVKKIEFFVEEDPVFQTMLEGIFIALHRPKYNDEVKDAKKKFGEKNDTTCQ
jgi:DNA polymerase III subunit epsilon